MHILPTPHPTSNHVREQVKAGRIRKDTAGLSLNSSYEAASCTISHDVNAAFKWDF